MRHMGYPIEDPEAETSVYSNRLEKLIRTLMEVDPEDRPTLDDIKEEVKNALKGWEKRLPGLKRKTEDQMPDFMRVSTRADDFRIGADLFEAMAKRRRVSDES
jgi:hypothetical protein